jgi:ABC-type hemin transport system ATPase subunit
MNAVRMDKSHTSTQNRTTSTRPQSSFDISHQHGTMNNARESARQQQKEDKPRSTQEAKK